MGQAAIIKIMIQEKNAMNNEFDIREKILYKYTGNETTVVIPNSVHIIHEKAFRYCSTIVSVEVPNSVTRIEWGAFSFCENLEQLIIPPSVNFISISAIEGSTKLKSIIIGGSKYYYAKGNQIFRVDDKNTVISIDILK